MTGLFELQRSELTNYWHGSKTLSWDVAYLRACQVVGSEKKYRLGENCQALSYIGFKEDLLCLFLGDQIEHVYML